MITEILTYFAEFVSDAALKKAFNVQRKTTDYNELKAAIDARTRQYVINDIAAFCYSTDLQLVSALARNTNGLVLAVEHGGAVYDPTSAPHTQQSIGVSVLASVPNGNSDYILESLINEQSYKVVLQILDKIGRDKKNNYLGCTMCHIINWPATINVVDPFLSAGLVGFSVNFELSYDD